MMPVGTETLPDTVIRGSLFADWYEFPLRVKATVSFSTQRPHSYDIRVGGHVHSAHPGDVCIFISVIAPPAPSLEDDDLPRYDISDEHKTALIEQVKYDTCCAMSETLHKGGGTAIMLRTACAYVLQVFQWVDNFRFTDTSYVTLDTSLQVPLPALCLCTSGTTWYEREFGAHIRKRAEHDSYRHLVEGVLQMPAAKPATIEQLCLRTGVQPSCEALKMMKSHYDSAPTLQAFFSALKEALSIEEFGSLVAIWVHDLLDSLLDKKHHKEWSIPASSFHPQDFQVRKGGSCDAGVVEYWEMHPNFHGCMSLPWEDA
jgi:hypothetical protein